MARSLRTWVVPALLTGGLAIVGCGDDSSLSGSTSGAATTSSGPENATITFAFTPASTNTCLKVTDERGIFRKHGITMKFAPAAPSGVAQIAQILNGQMTAGNGAYTGVIAAASNNLPVVITNATDKDYDADGQTALATIVGKNGGIRSFRDLEGKTVGVNSLQGTWELALREAVAKQGGDPSKVKLVVIPFSDQVTALKAGRVDAISTTQPLVSALTAEGYTSIGDPQAISLGTDDSVTSVTFMARKYVEENPDVVKRYIAALEEGNAWCNAHPEEMRTAIARITEIPEEALANTPAPEFTTQVDAAETNAWADLLVKYGVIENAPAVDEVQWSGVPLR